MIKFSLKLLTATVLLSAVNFYNPSYSMENEISEKLNTNVSFEEIFDYYLDVPDYKGKAEVAKTFCDKLLDNESLKDVLEDNNKHELESIYDMLGTNNVIKYLFDSFKDNIEVLEAVFKIVRQEKYNNKRGELNYYITNIRCKISSIINSIRLLRKELPININLSLSEIYDLYDSCSSEWDILSIPPEILKEAKQKCIEIFCNKLLDNKSLGNVLQANNKTGLYSIPYSIYAMLNENYVIERLFNLSKDNTERLYEIFDIVHQEKYNDIDYIADIRIDISALMLLIGKELHNLSFAEIYEIHQRYSNWNISSIQPEILKEAKQEFIGIVCNKLLDN